MHVQAESPGEQGNFGIPDSTDKYTGIPRDSRVTGIGTPRGCCYWFSLVFSILVVIVP